MHCWPRTQARGRNLHGPCSRANFDVVALLDWEQASPMGQPRTPLIDRSSTRCPTQGRTSRGSRGWATGLGNSSRGVRCRAAPRMTRMTRMDTRSSLLQTGKPCATHDGCTGIGAGHDTFVRSSMVRREAWTSSRSTASERRRAESRLRQNPISDHWRWISPRASPTLLLLRSRMKLNSSSRQTTLVNRGWAMLVQVS